MGRDSDEWRDADLEEARIRYEEKVHGTEGIRPQMALSHKIPIKKQKPWPRESDFRTKKQYLDAVSKHLREIFPAKQKI